MADYATAAAFRAYIHDPSGLDPSTVAQCLTAASRSVDADTGWADSSFAAIGTATAKKFVAEDQFECEFCDEGTRWGASSTAVAVATDDNYDGTYETVWAYGTDFILEPVNGARGGVVGWPYDEVRAVGDLTFPPPSQQQPYPVQITALWGWAATPTNITQATLLMASALYKRGDAPFGVAGFDAFGAVRVRSDPMYWHLLRPYTHASRWVA